MFLTLILCAVSFRVAAANGCPEIRGGLVNGKVTLDKSPINGQYPVGTKATFSCNPGYVLDAFGGYRCYKADSSHNSPYWFGFKVPRCDASCAPISAPANSKVRYNERSKGGRYVVNTRATFSCNVGYTKKWSWHPSHRTCQSVNHWDNWSPECKIVVCPALNSPSNGDISYNKSPMGFDYRYPYNTVQTTWCNSGYSLSGSSSRTCQALGTWSGNIPKCIKKKKKGCFPSMAKVNLENGKTVTMSELQIGDHVQAVLVGGRITYSKVKSFLNKQSTLTGIYKSMKTSVNTTVSLTENHLIYARKNSTEKFIPKYAEQISVDDEVLVLFNDELTSANVIKISLDVMQGFYVPVTEEGNIIVDSVLTSCYASFDHDLAHIIMTPIKWFPEIVEWVFGDDYGNSVYVKLGTLFGKWILSSDYKH